VHHHFKIPLLKPFGRKPYPTGTFVQEALEAAEMAAEDRRARAVEDAEKAGAFTQTFIP